MPSPGAFASEAVKESLQADRWLRFEAFVCGPLSNHRELEGQWEEEAQQVGALDNVLRAAWLLMRRPLAAIENIEPDRATRKRLCRLKRQPASVRLIGRRRPKSNSEKVDGSREYQHQWIVGGHWRQQWYSKRQVHRPVWIVPHVNGPEGTPMMDGEKASVDQSRRL
ncbi:hypothetical protein [Streptomyces canus]|uniref:hypothetical protein n=1 Tax=Streptomyces canus TaxID=58343 RepID=UPI0037F4A031